MAELPPEPSVGLMPRDAEAFGEGPSLSTGLGTGSQGEGCLNGRRASGQSLPTGARGRCWWQGGKGAPRTATWLACLERPCRHWALAPASEKAVELAWAREKLRFLEVLISTFVTVLSAKCRGGQEARD